MTLTRHHFLNICPILRESILEGRGQCSAPVCCLHRVSGDQIISWGLWTPYARSQLELKFFKFGYKLNINCNMLNDYLWTHIMAIRNGNDEVLQVRQDIYPATPNQYVSLFSLFAHVHLHGFHANSQRLSINIK